MSKKEIKNNAERIAEYLTNNKEAYNKVCNKFYVLDYLRRSVYNYGNGLDEECIEELEFPYEKELNDEEIFNMINNLKEEYNNLRQKYLDKISNNLYRFFEDEKILEAPNDTPIEVLLKNVNDSLYLAYIIYSDLPYLFNEVFFFILKLKRHKRINMNIGLEESLKELYDDCISALDDITDIDIFVFYYLYFILQVCDGGNILELYNIMTKRYPYDVEDEDAHKAFKNFSLLSYICGKNYMKGMNCFGFELTYEENVMNPTAYLYAINHHNSYDITQLFEYNNNYHHGQIKENDIGLYTCYDYKNKTFLVGVPSNIYELVNIFPSDENGMVKPYLISENHNLKKNLKTIFKYEKLSDLFIHTYHYIECVSCLDVLDDTCEKYRESVLNESDDLVKNISDDKKEFLMNAGKFFKERIDSTLESREKLVCYISLYSNGIVTNDFSLVLNDTRY